MDTVWMTKWDQRFIYIAVGLGLGNLFIHLIS